MSLRRWTPSPTTRHTVWELSEAALWLLQHEQYYRVGYVLLEYVTHVAIAKLSPEEQAAMYARLEQSAGLKEEVQTVTPLQVLAAVGDGGGHSSASVFETLWSAVTPRRSSAEETTAAPLFSMVEQAMALWAQKSLDPNAKATAVTHGVNGLVAYLSRGEAPSPHAPPAPPPAPSAAARRG